MGRGKMKKKINCLKIALLNIKTKYSNQFIFAAWVHKNIQSVDITLYQLCAVYDRLRLVSTGRFILVHDILPWGNIWQLWVCQFFQYLCHHFTEIIFISCTDWWLVWQKQLLLKPLKQLQNRTTLTRPVSRSVGVSPHRLTILSNFGGPNWN